MRPKRSAGGGKADAAFVGDDGAGFLDGGRVDVGTENLGALPRQQYCGCLAVTPACTDGARAGDECNLAL